MWLGRPFRSRINGVSAVTDNLSVLRTVEWRARISRLLSILKVRDSGYGGAIREFSITNHGIKLADTFTRAIALLSGLARPSNVAGA